MKTNFLSLFLVLYLLFSFSSCENRTQRNNEVTDSENMHHQTHTDQAGSLLVGTDGQKMDSLYRVLTEIPLPFVYNENFILNAPGFISLPQNMFNLFHNFDAFGADTRIAKLPEKGDFKPLIVMYTDNGGTARINLYTLSDSMKVIDRLQIYSTEYLGDDRIAIIQEFEIPDDYRIMLRKRLNNTVIEQLYYTLDDRKCFIEIRDGQTPAIAYESPDNEHYMVESFIWDHNSSGGVFKKDLSRMYYRISGNGMEEIREAEYNSSL